MEPGQQRSRGDGSDVVARMNNDFERIVASSFFLFFQYLIGDHLFARLPSRCNQRCGVRDVLLIATVRVSVQAFLRSGGGSLQQSHVYQTAYSSVVRRFLLHICSCDGFTIVCCGLAKQHQAWILYLSITFLLFIAHFPFHSTIPTEPCDRTDQKKKKLNFKVGP